MKCEVVREGRACSDTAVLIVRTPWATQLVCMACATSFKRYEASSLDFTCDWPTGGKECGEKATHYVELANEYHRPLCAAHAQNSGQSRPIDDGAFNPKLVPYKPPAQPQPRVVLSGDKLKLFCYCGKGGKYRPGVDTMPLCDEHYVPSTTSEPPPPVLLTPAVDGDIRTAAKELVLLTLRVLKEKIERWQ